VNVVQRATQRRRDDPVKARRTGEGVCEMAKNKKSKKDSKAKKSGKKK
jgi:hypothetical protein